MPTRPRPLRLLAASAAITATIALAACGDDDDQTNAANNDDAAAATDQSNTNPGEPATAAESGSDEDQIKALFARVQKAFVTPGQGQVICDALTPRGQDDIVVYGNGTGISASSCPAVINAMVQREIDLKTEQRPTKILTIRVRGSRATALIRITGTSPLRQRYVKQDGQWKITSFNLSAAVGGGTPPPQ